MFRRVCLYLFNLYFYTLFILLSAIVIPLLTLYVVCLAPFCTRRGTMKRFRAGIRWYGRVITFIPYPLIRLHYHCPESGEPEEACIFVCNHRSASDAFLMAVLPHELVQIVNVWPFRIPVLGIYARWAGYLNIRMMPPEEFMRRGTELLRDGVSLVFFPEGTRSTGRDMGSFHGSAFRLALASGAPLVPLCISGSETAPPKGSALLHPGTVRVRQMAAITRDRYRGMTPFAFKNRVWKIMERELALMENRA
jgi:1-acyl-sn-glycerol-3-phosphate acyltransferase